MDADFVEPASLEEAVEYHRKFLESYGWLIKIEENQVGIYREFKNKKLRKTPDVYLVYNTLNDEVGTRNRPWYIRSNITNDFGIFKSLTKAMEKFCEFSELSANKIGLKKGSDICK